jgi:hypothetical protein
MSPVLRDIQHIPSARSSPVERKVEGLPVAHILVTIHNLVEKSFERLGMEWMPMRDTKYQLFDWQQVMESLAARVHKE